jgi:hypothetical protein
MRYSRAVEQSSGATRLRSQREGAEVISNQTQPYESGASHMVGVLLASELIPLLADRPQLRGDDISKGNRGAEMMTRTGYFSVLAPLVGLLAASLSLKGDV